MTSQAGRVTGLGAAALSLGAAGAFFALARRAGEAPPPAIWGGSVWVFLLSMIVTLPLLTALRGRWGPTRADGGSSMTLALAVWACTLPFVLLLIVPRLGVQAAVITALALLAAIAIVCWTVCAWGRTRGETATGQGGT